MSRIAVIGTGYVGLTTGACFAHLGHDVICEDLDHDGLLDIYVGVDAQSGNRFATSKGGNPLYTRRAGEWKELAKEWGIKHEANCVCVPAVDFDNDGDLDLLLVNFYSNVVLYRNDTDDKNWLRVKAVGTKSNPDGIGAKVRVYRGDLPDAPFKELVIKAHKKLPRRPPAAGKSKEKAPAVSLRKR